MTRTRLGLLSFCAVVLGLMALSTAGAQAEPTARWLILNSIGELKEGSTLHASLGLEAETPTLVLHAEILKIKFLLSCTGIKGVNAKLLAEGSIGESAGNVKGSKALFSGCAVDLNGVTEPACTPTDPNDGAGFIVTNPLHALLVLGVAGEKLIKVIPDEGETFATIVTGSKCPIGTSDPIIGKLLLKDCENKGSEHLVKHLLEEGPGTELFLASLTPEHKATLLGSAWASLVGEHAGLKFGGDWAEETVKETAKWLILKNEAKEGSTLHASLGLEAESPTLVLHSEILKIKVLFLCTGVKAVNATLQKEGTIAKEYNGEGKPVGSTVLFSGCTTDLNGVTEPKCVPTDPTDGAGFIVTKPGHALLVLGAAGEKLTKVLPDSTEAEPEFARIVTGSGKCAIGTSVPVIGKLFLKDCENKGEEHLVKHLLEEGPGSALFTISLTTEHKATLLGSSWAFLTEEHTGLKFGGDWAEETAKWLILKIEVKEGSTLHASLGLEIDTPTLVLHTEILKIKALFLCTGVSAINAKLLAEGSIGEAPGVVSGSKLQLSGCTTELNGVKIKECVPFDPVDGEGFIVTQPLHAVLILGSAGEKLLNLLPDVVASEPEFAKIVTGGPGSECAIGTSVAIIGKLNLKDCENKGSEHLVKHLVEEGPGTNLAAISLTTEHTVTLLGSAWASLVGEHAGLKFGGDWA
jgi:hypothetical protein